MKIEALHKLFLKHPFACTDTRKISKNCLFFALKGKNFNGNKFAKDALEKGAAYAIVDEKSSVLNNNYILVKNVLKTLQELAAYHRKYLGLKIIALTGSNGKTTTKELINAVLKKKYITVATIGNLNNHIGVPLTLLSMDEKTEIGIVEMGANHLKEIEFLCNIAEPDYGYITNFGKAHLEGFGSLKGVIKGKSELYNYLKTHDKNIFVNSEDDKQVSILKGYTNTYCFGSDISNDVVIHFKEAKPYVISEFQKLTIFSKLIGNYNFSNISVAITIGNYFKVDNDAIKNAIENYIPTNNRSQIIQIGSNKIILDAYNANPSSMKAALENFEKQKDIFKIAILGDMFELGTDAQKEHQYIVDLASTMALNHLILIGENFYKTKIVSPKTLVFKSFKDFKTNFNFSQLEKASILIKGSRGMALERIIEIL